jgi:hypothetical protein
LESPSGNLEEMEMLRWISSFCKCRLLEPIKIVLAAGAGKLCVYLYRTA